MDKLNELKLEPILIDDTILRHVKEIIAINPGKIDKELRDRLQNLCSLARTEFLAITGHWIGELTQKEVVEQLALIQDCVITLLDENYNHHKYTALLIAGTLHAKLIAERNTNGKN